MQSLHVAYPLLLELLELLEAPPPAPLLLLLAALPPAPPLPPPLDEPEVELLDAPEDEPPEHPAAQETSSAPAANISQGYRKFIVVFPFLESFRPGRNRAARPGC